MKEVVKEKAITLLLSLASIFAPTKEVLLTVMAMSMVDLVTGIMASRKQGKPLTSAGLKRTVVKVFVYQVAVLAAFLVQTYLTGNLIPAMNFVASLIGLTELKSVLENLDIVNGGSLFRSLIDKLERQTTGSGKGDDNRV